MGVQKSRKSLRHAQHNLCINKKYKKTFSQRKLTILFISHKKKNTRVFSLITRQTSSPVFF
jgi:hypothetical protein